jgi:hypothetical protein
MCGPANGVFCVMICCPSFCSDYVLQAIVRIERLLIVTGSVTKDEFIMKAQEVSLFVIGTTSTRRAQLVLWAERRLVGAVWKVLCSQCDGSGTKWVRLFDA